ncbi:MAG TPA: methyltransferase domain-containing protein [Thermoanaerobaculia bacterium]|nr:methyltransferase domain-containing protein [Thermoanaerobaculia bacterium]
MSEREPSVRERLEGFWDTSHDYYEQARAANPEVSPERRRLFAHLVGGERVLDLGAGSCENALWLPAGCRFVGLDVSTVALATADALDRPGRRVRGDGAALPFATASFDAVISTWALEHFYDPPATFLEAARVTRPGGLLLFVGSAWNLPWEMPPSLDPARRGRVAFTRLARQLAAAAGGRHLFEVVREPRVLTEGYVPDADAVHVPQSWLLGRFLAAAGLEIVALESLPHRSDPPGPRGLLRRALRRVPPWRHGWGNLYLVARRGPELGSPLADVRSL